MKKVLSVIMAGICVLGMTACGKTSESVDSDLNVETTTEVTSEENEDDSAAINTDENKKAILVVSFGTSYNETRDKTIGAVENKIAETYADYEVRRAFTSDIIMKKLKERDGLEIDNVEQAMNKLHEEGFGQVIVQPTHVMNGFEYDEMKEAVAPFEGKFSSLIYGEPLLIEDKDYEDVINSIMSEITEAKEEGTAIVFMGHGTEHPANSTYANLNVKLKEMGYNNVFVGTVESEPSFDDVLADVNNSGAKKVVLYPFMIVAGDHATNDMAGDEENSWKTLFKKEGYEVEAVLKGLGEYEGIRNLFAEHVKKAIEG